MKRNLLLFSKQTLLFCLFLISSVSWGQTYTQVTTTGTLVDGVYLVVGDVVGTGTDGLMLNTVSGTPFINYTAISNPGASITTGVTSSNEFQITVASGVITIYNAAAIGYVSWGRTGNTGNTATFYDGTVADTERWTATVSGGIWTLSNVGTPGRSLQWNSGSPRFAAYTSAQTRLKLYRKANNAPTASSVSVSGTTNVGQQLTGTYTYADAESDPQGTSTFKWYRADDATGTNEAAIGSATSSTYTLVGGDLNKYIRFSVVPVASSGTATGTETFSSRVGPVGAGSTPVATIAGTLNEATLNTATVSLTLANETFADATLSPANFTLANAPTGVTVSNVSYDSATTATITLAYDNTDFDTNVTNFNVTIAGAELTLGTPLTSNNISITAVTETLTLGTITTFGNQCINVLSAEQQFTISGSNLKAGNISLAALSGFTYSETAGGTYTATLSFANSAGTLTNKIIYVKFLPTVVQSYNGNIAVSSNGAPTVNRAVVGSGVNTAPTVTSPTSTALTATTATLGGTITVAGCSTITERGIFYSTTNGFANGAGTKVSVTGSFSTGAFTVGATALTSNTVYYYKAFATSASSGTAYSAQGTFTTTCGVATVPFLQNFESVTTPALPTCSTLQNAGTGNNWVTASINDFGFSSKVLDYSYNSTNAANAWYFTQGISLTAGTIYQISYKYGNNKTDYIEKLKVAYGTATVNTAMTNALADYPNITGAVAVTATNYFVAPSTGVFYFGFNAYSDVNEWDLYVDDIAIDVAPTCVVPTAVAASAITAKTATLSWTASFSNPTNGYDYYYATSATAPNGSTTPSGSVAAGVTTANLSGLTSSTTYYFWVRANCGSGDTSTWTAGGSFITAALAAPTASVASNVASTSFTASWSSVANATSYVLDVYQSSQAASSTTETFTAIGGGTSSGYFDRSWTGVDGITWTAYNSRTDQVVNTGNEAITLRDASGAYLQSGEISGFVQKISFDVKQVFAGSGGALTLTIYSGAGFATATVVGTYSYSTTAQTITAPIAPSIEGPFKIELRNNAAARPVIDNLKIDRLIVNKTYFTQNQNVGNTTSFAVTGLNPETQYRYVVRASDGQSSANSNEITFTTLMAPITWNGTAWSNITGPTASADAFIDGNYSSTAAIICKDLTVNPGKVLTIKATSTLTVAGNIANNGSIVFESTAAGTGRFATYNGAPIGGVGSVTVERYIPAKRAWRLLAAPVRGTTNNSVFANWQNNGAAGDSATGIMLWDAAGTAAPTAGNNGLFLGPQANIRSYNDGVWSSVTNTNSTPLFSATGNNAFLVFATGPHDSSTAIAGTAAATTVKSTGTNLITGSVSQSLVGGQFKLIANPYASPINTAALIANNAGSKLWLIDPSVGLGAYVTYDGNLWSIPTTGSDALIQSGQAFFVRTATNSTFTITEADKVAGNSDNWFSRNATQDAPTADKIRVLLYKQEAATWKIADGALAVNQASGNTEVDDADARKINNFNESLMFRNGTTNLAIEYRALPQVGDVQQLRMLATTAIPYQLRVYTESYTNSTLQPYLEDTTTGALTAIPMDGSEVVVPFTGIVSSTTAPDLRFRIVYQTNLSTTAPSLTNVKVYPNPVVNGQLHINLGANTTNAKYMITNLLGQSVQQGELATTQNTISVPTLTKGMYILNISQEERTYTTKIYVQ